MYRFDLHLDLGRVWRTTLGFIPAAGLIALLEESVFRGYVLQQLQVCSTSLAVIGSSTAYALVHLRPTSVWPGILLELGGLFLLGLVLAIATLRTQQLYLAMGLHGSLAYCARVNKLFLEIPDSSLRWLTGTNRLVNGIGAWVLLVGLGGLVWVWGRRLSGPSSRSASRLQERGQI